MARSRFRSNLFVGLVLVGLAVLVVSAALIPPLVIAGLIWIGRPIDDFVELFARLTVGWIVVCAIPFLYALFAGKL